MIVISAIFNQMSHEIAAGQEAQTSKEWTLRHLGGGALALARKKNHLALETYGSTVPQSTLSIVALQYVMFGEL